MVQGGGGGGEVFERLGRNVGSSKFVCGSFLNLGKKDLADEIK